MNRPLKLILPAAICLVTLIPLYAFRTVPQSRLWKGWTLLYVTDGVMSEDEVSRVLAEKGCKGVISRSGQREPIVSPLSPIQKRSRNSYMQRREAFFSDEAATAMIFYVPEIGRAHV